MFSSVLEILKRENQDLLVYLGENKATKEHDISWSYRVWQVHTTSLIYTETKSYTTVEEVEIKKELMSTLQKRNGSNVHLSIHWRSSTAWLAYISLYVLLLDPNMVATWVFLLNSFSSSIHLFISLCFLCALFVRAFLKGDIFLDSLNDIWKITA